MNRNCFLENNSCDKMLIMTNTPIRCGTYIKKFLKAYIFFFLRDYG